MDGENQVADTSTESQEAPQVSEMEARARAMGWVDKDEYQGDGDWRPAKEFVERGELFGKIEAQRRELKELRKNQEAFSQHLSVARAAGAKEALTKLRAEKRQAFIDGDPDAVLAAEDKIEAAKEELRRASIQPVPQANPADAAEFQASFQNWQTRNTWYSTQNRAMVDFADAEGQRLVSQGNLSPKEILQEVEARVRREFPHKFTNPNRANAPGVEGSPSNRAGGSRKETYQLSDAERKVMNRLVRSGTLTEAQYIADLKAAKGN